MLRFAQIGDVNQDLTLTGGRRMDNDNPWAMLEENAEAIEKQKKLILEAFSVEDLLAELSNRVVSTVHGGYVVHTLNGKPIGCYKMDVEGVQNGQ